MIWYEFICFTNYWKQNGNASPEDHLGKKKKKGGKKRAPDL